VRIGSNDPYEGQEGKRALRALTEFGGRSFEGIGMDQVKAAFASITAELNR
jgi:hypothetical protein